MFVHHNCLNTWENHGKGYATYAVYMGHKCVELCPPACIPVTQLDQHAQATTSDFGRMCW